MKRLITLVAACIIAAGPAAAGNEGLGLAAVYRPKEEVKSVAVFLSGDGGWELGVLPMAKKLVDQNALVIGINTPKLLKGLEAETGDCIDPASAILATARQIMAQNGVPAKLRPVLVGYSSGAVLAYTSLVQAKAGSFGGGIGLGFCPDLETHKPLCHGESLTHVKNPKGPGFVYETVPRLSTPFIALQGGKDRVCDPPATNRFIAAVDGAKIINLPNVGHGFSVPKNWMSQYADAYRSLALGTVHAESAQ